MSELLERITIEAAGESAESILEYHPDLEADDIRACLAYAARELSHPVIESAA